MSLLSLTLYALASVAEAAGGKRGLVFTPNPSHPQDNKLWRPPGNDLTWYYNYGSIPSPAYADVAQDQFEFVPMMWGVGADPKDDKWLREVKGVISDGRNITHALAFNEPDAPNSWGGSNVDPRTAAQAWVVNFEPLAAMNVKLGLPAVTGAPAGLDWLKQFLGNCSALVSSGGGGGGQTKNCTFDFIPLHWYDNFAGLASHIGERRALWPDAEIWITEYAFAHQDLSPTQQFFNQTVDYFDKESYIGRYSYFGAFRSNNSTVGANAPFLNNAGKLTDIGSWYLGKSATGVNPQSMAFSVAPSGLVAGSVAAVAAVVMAWA
ncbi:hypothetical protein V2A60_002751 [Cordyceps javanica]|uniref:Glycoside hydrolase n=1 Tax=Cordyceps javanica TaxID=43265 RepID=A0A545UXL1_9HYPO|nr:Glycoside hydrolase [Cordyceps javanica]TQW06076.1 Glycoside hydrolase [Cordyceps javanica]